MKAIRVAQCTAVAFLFQECMVQLQEGKKEQTFSDSSDRALKLEAQLIEARSIISEQVGPMSAYAPSFLDSFGSGWVYYRIELSTNYPATHASYLHRTIYLLIFFGILLHKQQRVQLTFPTSYLMQATLMSKHFYELEDNRYNSYPV